MFDEDPYTEPMMNNTVNYKKVVPDYETPFFPDHHQDYGSSDEAYPYSVPQDAIDRGCLRAISNDYESIPSPAECTPTAVVYSTVIDNTLEYNETLNKESSILTNYNEVHSDPGHSEANVSTSFKMMNSCEIKINDVSILNKLGSGEFRTVHLGLWSNGSADPIQVAVKTLNSRCSESDRVKFLREAAIMGQFVHNNVVQLHGVVTEEENMMIVMEYMPEGNLQSFLTNLRNVTLPEALNELKHDLLSYCRHVSAGLSHLSSKGFVHRDLQLAARNILVSSDDVCKIGNFGMAEEVADHTYCDSTDSNIPVKWTAPEVILYNDYSVQSNVWSFGCVVYEIWSLGHKPFEDISGNEYFNKITTGYRLPPPPGCPRAIYELMIQCWHPVANKRINACTIFKMLQKSDRTLLNATVLPKDNGELPTVLGDPLTSSSHLYLELQNIYLSH